MSNILNNPTYFSEDNTVAYYKLDWDATATIWTDWTPSNVTWVDSARWYTSECGSFNNSTSQVSFSAWNWYTTFSIAGWINMDTLPILDWSWHWVVWAWSWSAWKFLYQLRRRTWDNGWNSYLIFQEYTQSVSESITYYTAPFSTATWYFVVVTVDVATKTANVYVDNILHLKNVWTNMSNIDCNSALIWDTFQNAQMDWWMWEFRFINSILTENEMDQLYQQWLRKYWPTAQLPTFTTSLSPTAFYPLNWDANDYVGSNNGTWNWTEWYSPVWGWEWATFDWSTDYISHWNTWIPTWNSSFTYNIWVNTDTITWYHSPFWVSSTTAWKWVLISTDWGNNDWTLLAWIWYWTQFNSVWAISVWEWSMLTLTHNWTTCKLYINWVFDSSQTLTFDVQTTYPRIWNTVNTVWSSIQYWDWDIWPYWIYNTELSADDITKLYNEQSKWVIWNKYSLPNLRDWLVLDISKKAVSWTYYSQDGSWNNGTATNVTDSSLGLNNVMSFNGSSSVITWTYRVPNTIWLNISFSVWFKTTTNPTAWQDPQIFSNYVWWTNSIITCWIQTNLIYFWGRDSNAVSDSISVDNTPYRDWEWHLLTCVKNWNDKYLYIDAVQVATSSTAYTWHFDSWKDILWGRRWDTTYYWYNWDMIAPKIYNRALSAEEVQQLYYSEYIQS